ncbi:hypothetical protein ACIRPQ_34635 [Streptomyces sp. NPDC101213]|uniref:hypothetical protein n=1 Tax=Streptomyces sp. NPDC101213 TaxID=3366130 RepID=UPI00381AD9AB
MPRVLPGVEAGVLEGRRDDAGIPPLRPAPYDAPSDPGGVDHFLAFASIACTLICYRRLAS